MPLRSPAGIYIHLCFEYDYSTRIHFASNIASAPLTVLIGGTTPNTTLVFLHSQIRTIDIPDVEAIELMAIRVCGGGGKAWGKVGETEQPIGKASSRRRICGLLGLTSRRHLSS